MASPITSVQPIDFYGSPTGDAVTGIPSPSKYDWTLSDISAPDAGRSEDMMMNKMRKGQSRSVDLEWKYPTLPDAALILNAFNSEYVRIILLDPMEGAYVSKRFYVGDRKVPAFNMAFGRWESISFSIIQQDADKG